MELTDYLSIGALIVSGISLLLSWRTSRRDKLRGEYDNKRDIFFAAKHYFDELKNRQGMSKEEKEKLKFDLQKFFGNDILEKFTRAENAIRETWTFFDDMKVLFETLREDDPQEAERVEELFCADPEFNPQEYQELQDYLDNWNISFLQEIPGRNRMRYSYREIETELKKATGKADAACSDFESAVTKKIKYS